MGSTLLRTSRRHLKKLFGRKTAELHVEELDTLTIQCMHQNAALEAFPFSFHPYLFSAQRMQCPYMRHACTQERVPLNMENAPLFKHPLPSFADLLVLWPRHAYNPRHPPPQAGEAGRAGCHDTSSGVPSKLLTLHPGLAPVIHTGMYTCTCHKGPAPAACTHRHGCASSARACFACSCKFGQSARAFRVEEVLPASARRSRHKRAPRMQRQRGALSNLLSQSPIGACSARPDLCRCQSWSALL